MPRVELVLTHPSTNTPNCLPTQPFYTPVTKYTQSNPHSPTNTPIRPSTYRSTRPLQNTPSPASIHYPTHPFVYPHTNLPARYKADPLEPSRAPIRQRLTLQFLGLVLHVELGAEVLIEADAGPALLEGGTVLTAVLGVLTHLPEAELLAVATGVAAVGPRAPLLHRAVLSCNTTTSTSARSSGSQTRLAHAIVTPPPPPPPDVSNT